jgi:hypothetical protein
MMMDHPEEILEKGMEVGVGGLAPQEMNLPGVEIDIVALLKEEEGISVREEVLLPGKWGLQEEDLPPEETLAEMMIVEEVLLIVHLLKVFSYKSK